MDITEKTRKYLLDQDAFELPNPTVAKAITMRRLMDEGFSESDAHQAISENFRQLEISSVKKDTCMYLTEKRLARTPHPCAVCIARNVCVKNCKVEFQQKGGR